jgi:hypothetical protein
MSQARSASTDTQRQREVGAATAHLADRCCSPWSRLSQCADDGTTLVSSARVPELRCPAWTSQPPSAGRRR